MMSMMMRTYLMKLMLQQSESRFFGFFILICFCGCFLLESVLLPLLLLLLLLLWLLAEPFLVDLFGAIALLVFVFTSRVFFRSTFSSLCLCRAFNSSCFFFAALSQFDSLSQHHIVERPECFLFCTAIHSLGRRFSLANESLLCVFHQHLRLATELIAFRLCQHWTLIIAVFFMLSIVCRFYPFSFGLWLDNNEKHLKTCAPTILCLPFYVAITQKAVSFWLLPVSHRMPRNKLAKRNFNFKCHQSMEGARRARHKYINGARAWSIFFSS